MLLQRKLNRFKAGKKNPKNFLIKEDFRVLFLKKFQETNWKADRKVLLTLHFIPLF